MKTEYKYIHFRKVRDFWVCYNTKHGDCLATVEYYEPWNQYVFKPIELTVYNISCLDDIKHFMEQLNEKRKNS